MSTIKSLLALLSVLFCTSLQANVEAYFNRIHQDPNALYAFFKAMPKGGELHYHLAGGPYPETMLQLAATGDYCLDKNTLSMSKTTTACDGINAKELANHPELYSQIVKSWSMKDFVAGRESGHDHFFNGFGKYLPLVMDFRPQLLADVMKRAANQYALYLEIMALPDNAKSAGFGAALVSTTSFEQKRNQLLANKAFQANIEQTVSESERIVHEARNSLGCNTSNAAGCQVQVQLLYYVLREQPLDKVFAQALNGFEAVSRSKGALVGLNLVQAEDGILSLRDYRKQMEIFKFLHQHYPQVQIALHAGELAQGLVVPEELRYHIHDALFTGQAKRIGHGVAIAYENTPKETLAYMAKNQIPVEINLISNRQILSISGANHPLNYYLAHQVPVVLSTDDEGVLRTDLTQQYVEAAYNHRLSYQALKQINRNALTYAFVPGKSLWLNAAKATLVHECQDLTSPSCLKFVKDNPKASLQRQLELQLKAFEEKFRT